jgi:carbon storage regulator
MLVLARRPGEKLIIGRDITVTVVLIQGDKVRIGIEAPREIAIHRMETYAAHRDKGRLEQPCP